MENNPIDLAKNYFYDHLSKGRILKIDEINLDSTEDEFKLYHNLLSKWYFQILDLSFLPELMDDLEEIFIHSPTQIHFKSSTTQETFDCDLTELDLEGAFDILALNHHQDWNYKNPYCSFYGEFRNFPVRYTLIHRSTSPNKKSKLFIRLLQKNIINLNEYKEHSQFLKNAMTKKKNILIAGATGSGKTTFLNSLINELDQNEHLIIIEDTQELNSPSETTTRFITDDKFENKSMNHYMKYALRMSPERIILGEIRSEEIEPALLSMNTGHNGFLATIHANSAVDALKRMALLFKIYSKKDLSYELVLNLVCSNIDYVIFLENKKIVDCIEVYGSQLDQILFDQARIN